MCLCGGRHCGKEELRREEIEIRQTERHPCGLGKFLLQNLIEEE